MNNINEGLTDEQIEFLNNGAGKGKWEQDENGLINVNGHFDCKGLRNEMLGEFKGFRGIRFGSIEGDFSGYNIGLKSLEGAPRNVRGNFMVSHNELVSTKGSPIFVGGTYDISNNKIISLEDMTINICESILYYSNPLGIEDLGLIYRCMKREKIDFELALAFTWEDLTKNGKKLLEGKLSRDSKIYMDLKKINVL